MSNDIIDLPPEDKGTPGEIREVGEGKYMVFQFAAPGVEITLPSGRKIRPLRILIDEMLGRLYLTSKARDN